MIRRFAAATFLPVLVAAFGCSEADKSVPSDLEEDLRQSEATTVELAPSQGDRIEVARELLGKGETSPRKSPANAGTPKDSIIETLATAPAGDPISRLDSTVQARRPRPVQAPQPARQGPYKSTSEVIRDAPFPIKP